jgi:hypothetical protein
VFANADSRGYYFTDYAPDDVRALAKNTAWLKPQEWMSLLGDEWWMVRAGRHDIDVYLDVTDALATSDFPTILAMLQERLSVNRGHDRESRRAATVRSVGARAILAGVEGARPAWRSEGLRRSSASARRAPDDCRH